MWHPYAGTERRTAHRIDALAKVMIVTRSRKHAVRYHRILERTHPDKAECMVLDFANDAEIARAGRGPYGHSPARPLAAP